MTNDTINNYQNSYVELGVISNFSFLEGGSHPEELAKTASALGYHALALADKNTLSGAVRFYMATKDIGVQGIIGSRIETEDGDVLICFPTDIDAYSRLTRLLTLGKRRTKKSKCKLWRDDVIKYALGQILIILPPKSFCSPTLLKEYQESEAKFSKELAEWGRLFPGSVYLGTSVLYGGEDKARLNALFDLSKMAGVPMVATNDVLYHHPKRRPLQDVLTCIRNQSSIDQAGFDLELNSERYLKPPSEMTLLFKDYPEAIARTIEIAKKCQFSLAEVNYEYPDVLIQPGNTVEQELGIRTWEGANKRYPFKSYPDGVPANVQTQLKHELNLINKLKYAPYFLTVYDIVNFARSRNILCQGRGSAANSAVCYCLGITAVDPSCSDILFERFISEARDEPPDIDIDFEHERREEIIQYIYKKYGRERAGLAATVVTFRSRSAIREVGKVMGLSDNVLVALTRQVCGSDSSEISNAKLKEIGLDPRDRILRIVLKLSQQLIGFPRHLSQHVGGFVITRGRLDELVPIENATMHERTVIEWDKDDLDALGILKIDVLALGMLSCIQKGFELIYRHYGHNLDLASVPSEDSAVYDMLCKGDSLGVFQLESRAQMAMLPRLKPRCFYDLVIEVAIVRPGPIQGDMVHPYIRRRNGYEAVELPSEELRQVLGKTLGVPLFQEQAMKIAIIAAGFTPSEADQLRRAMTAFRKTDKIGALGIKMIEGMVKRGYQHDFAERCFRQIEGFGNYGFPESHAASFALLVYVSSWMKCHMPAAFTAALMNSQPMGFYAPAQIVRDARDHGVDVFPPDVNYIGWDCDLEHQVNGKMALRLGLRQIKGLRKEDALLIEKNRESGYSHLSELISRAGVRVSTLELLARGDAFQSMGLSRREAFWAVRGIASFTFEPIAGTDKGLPLFNGIKGFNSKGMSGCEPTVSLPVAGIGEEVVDDYNALRLSLKSHPLALLRKNLLNHAYEPTSVLQSLRNRSSVRLAGLVLVRQRPSTAKGIMFMTIEDEAGVANLVVWSRQFERFRYIVTNAKLLGVTGKLQREGKVIHVLAERFEDLTYKLNELMDQGGQPKSEDAIIHSDEFKNIRAGVKNNEQSFESEKVAPLKLETSKLCSPKNEKVLRVVSRNFH